MRQNLQADKKDAFQQCFDVETQKVSRESERAEVVKDNFVPQSSHFLRKYILFVSQGYLETEMNFWV